MARSLKKEILVIKIVDFRKDKDEPGFDVEVFRKGKYVGSPDYVFSTRTDTDSKALKMAKEAAIEEIEDFYL